MALINDSIYQNAPRSLIREGLMGYDNAMKAKTAGINQRGLLAQQNEYTRSQEFNKTLGLLAQSNDHRTPEGQQAIIRGLGQKGFGAEAMELAQKFPRQAENTQKWHRSSDGAIFNDSTGEFKTQAPAPAAPGAPATAPTWKGERFVRSKDNTMVKVDANGTDQAGNKVEVWSPPARPSAGPKPLKPAGPPKGLSGDAAKTLSIASTLQDDIQAMSGAFTKDFAGSIAGLKTGTNRYLIKVADQISDKVGRLRSGGAVNADEEARFARLISSLRDAAFSTPEEANMILNDLAKEAAFVAEGMDPGGSVRARIRETLKPKEAPKAQNFTKPEEEDEYQAWKKAQK